MERLIDADVLMRNVSLTKTLTQKDALADAIFDVVATLIDSAPTVEPQPQWISVKDGLPEKDWRVLAYSSSMKGSEAQIQIVKGWMCHNPKTDITYWMPLPEPPKEDENE